MITVKYMTTFSSFPPDYTYVTIMPKTKQGLFIFIHYLLVALCAPVAQLVTTSPSDG